MEKEIKVIGGISDGMWGGKQFRQQYRVIDKNRICYSQNASAIPILMVRKWKKQQK